MSRPHADTDAFRAIADPTRRRIIDLLRSGERPVSDLVSRFALSGPSLSHHLNVLRRAGLIHPRRVGRQLCYRADVRKLADVSRWLSRHTAGQKVVQPA